MFFRSDAQRILFIQVKSLDCPAVQFILFERQRRSSSGRCWQCPHEGVREFIVRFSYHEEFEISNRSIAVLVLVVKWILSYQRSDQKGLIGHFTSGCTPAINGHPDHHLLVVYSELFHNKFHLDQRTLQRIWQNPKWGKTKCLEPKWLSIIEEYVLCDPTTYYLWRQWSSRWLGIMFWASECIRMSLWRFHKSTLKTYHEGLGGLGDLTSWNRAFVPVRKGL